MASNLTDQVRSISEVTKAVASGDLTKLVDVDVQGEMLDLKETVQHPLFHTPREVLICCLSGQLYGLAAQYFGKGSQQSEFGGRNGRYPRRTGRCSRCARHVEGQLLNASLLSVSCLRPNRFSVTTSISWP